MANSKMVAYWEVENVTKNSFSANMYIKHDMYKSYSRSVLPYANRRLKETALHILSEATLNGYVPQVSKTYTRSGFESLTNTEEIEAFDCESNETVTRVRFLVENP